MDKQKKDRVIKEASKFCLDMAKLVFAGIILAGIMQTASKPQFFCGGQELPY